MTNKGVYFSGGQSEPRAAPRAVRVLVVDDDVDTVSTLLTLLRDEGFQARGASTGWGAMEQIKSFDPDAVLLDIALNDLSGWDVARRIRSSKGRSRPLIIGISGRYTQGADKVLAQLAGINHYILKPYDPNVLLRLLEPLSQSR